MKQTVNLVCYKEIAILNSFSCVCVFFEGPNTFASENVWVEQDDHLHMMLRRSPTTGKWTCADISTTKKFSYGTFQWYLNSRIDKLDQNVVFGLLTYDTLANEQNMLVINVVPQGSNLHYYANPRTPGDSEVMSADSGFSLNGDWTTHRIIWMPSSVTFESLHDHTDVPYQNGHAGISQYQTPATFSSKIPVIDTPIHMNLWMTGGEPPQNGQDVEIIIQDFKFTPMT